MIKTVIFDVDNTLYSYTKAHETAFLALTGYAERELGISPEDFISLHKKTEHDLKESMGEVAAIHNRLIRYQNMLESRQLPLYPHVLKMNSLYWDTLLKTAVPFDGVAEVFEQLKNQKIRIGIGTDMTARVQFEKLTALGLIHYIDFLVSSEEAGKEKPDAIFFEKCIKKAGCRASECLFVGDSLQKDVLGSERAGIHGVWYCPEETKPAEAVLQITDLRQLPEIMERLKM